MITGGMRIAEKARVPRGDRVVMGAGTLNRWSLPPGRGIFKPLIYGKERFE
jgi:hypothetical protein